MAERGRFRSVWWLPLVAVAVTVFVLDQLTKWWAEVALGDGQVIDVVWTLRFRLIHNTGSAFSLGEGQGVWISLAALGAVALLVRSGRRTRDPWTLLALGLIVGGAFGNLVDRAFRVGEGVMGGGVVDFIDFQWWPVFNVADMGVVGGAILLVVASWRNEQLIDSGDRRAPEGDVSEPMDDPESEVDVSEAEPVDGPESADSAGSVDSPESEDRQNGREG